jgi:hypothetical protein
MAPIRENPSRIIPIAIIVLGVVAGYLFYSMSIKGSAAEIPPPVVAPNDVLSKFKELDLDFSIFDDLRFKSLKIFGESPVQPGQTGRADIFAPF